MCAYACRFIPARVCIHVRTRTHSFAGEFHSYDARFRHALTAEMSETFPSGGSMHASVKLEGIDGRAPQERVEHVA